MQNFLQDQSHYSVAVIGGGLAGSAVGSMLAKAGWSVAIFERDRFPRDKVCGEFLSGESRRLLEKIGCLAALQLHDPPEIQRAKFVSQSGRELIVELPEPALGVSRSLLDKTLFEHACSCGADGFTQTEVRRVDSTENARIVQVVDTGRAETSTSSISANIAIGAYGRRGKLDADLNRPFLKTIDRSIGLKLHHRPVSIATDGGAAYSLSANGTTEIYALDGGYCGINMVEAGLVNVCMLLESRAFKKLQSNKWNEVHQFITQGNQALKTRLQSLVPINDQVLTVAGMPFRGKEQSLNDLFFIGDAAGMIAPLCGDGQAMALESGVALADLLNSRIQTKRLGDGTTQTLELGTEWQNVWNSQYGKRMQLARHLQNALLRPAVANTVIGTLRYMPRLATYLAGATRSHSSANASERYS